MSKNKTEKVEAFFRVEHGLIKDDGVIAKVGVNAFAVYMVLLSYVNGESGLSYPGYKGIKEKTGMGQGTISKALETLEKHGLIEKKSKGTKQGDNSTYVVHSRPTKTVEGDSKRDMSRPKKEKKEKEISTPIVAPPVVESEPVKVVQAESSNEHVKGDTSTTDSSPDELDVILRDIFNLSVEVNDRSYPHNLGVDWFITSRRNNLRNYGGTPEKALEKFKLERAKLQNKLDKV
jgi:predicted transcriptional regulator